MPCFPNPDRLLLPGQFVTVMLRESASESRVVVPQAAVQANQAGHFLLVVGEDNRAEARPVVMGPRDGPRLGGPGRPVRRARS